MVNAGDVVARKIMNIFMTVLLVVLVCILVMVFVARVSGNIPSILGYSIFRVSSDSMEPTLMVGDVILVKSVSPEDIHTGDILTYQGTTGQMEGKTITHQVIQEPYEVDGVYHIQTKGIREGAVADPEITYDQVKGRYVTTLRFIDKLYSFFLSPLGLISFIALIVILFTYEMISLIMSYKTLDEKDDDYYAPPNRKPKHKRKKAK